MRLVICRVKGAELKIDGKVTENIGKGLFCLLGMTDGDTEKETELLVKKCVNMRIFSDENDKMNLSVKDIGGEILVEPNFTLYGNIRRGNRPDFFGAMEPVRANELFECFKRKLSQSYGKVKFGVFGADMHTDVKMDGPVTIIADTRELS